MEWLNIMQFVYVAVVVLILFGATIFVHELGHFLLARRYRLRIERFSIGFGPRIWGVTRDGVEYRLSWFPFGGYVALPQMSPLDEEEQKRYDPPLEPAHPWSKIVVAVAGGAFNIAFALLLAVVIWWVGKPVDSSELDLTIGYVPRQSEEYSAGLRSGDRIISINGETVDDWGDINQAVAFSRRPLLEVEIEREGQRQSIHLKPDPSPVFGVRFLRVQPRAIPRVNRVEPGSPAAAGGMVRGDEIVAVDGIEVLSGGHLLELVQERGDKPSEFLVRREGREERLLVTPRVEKLSQKVMIGVGFESHTRQITVHPDPWKQFKEVILLMAKTINALIHHKQTGVGAKDLAGPVGIGTMLWTIIPTDLRLAISFTVLLNINLAILNLLPIPVLDGGHIMFALFEWIRRKPLSYKFASVTQTVFAVLLVTFILYVTYHDVLRLLRIRMADSARDREPRELRFDPPLTAPEPTDTTAPARP